jgi:hypothetical protein
MRCLGGGADLRLCGGSQVCSGLPAGGGPAELTDAVLEERLFAAGGPKPGMRRRLGWSPIGRRWSAR